MLRRMFLNRLLIRKVNVGLKKHKLCRTMCQSNLLKSIIKYDNLTLKDFMKPDVPKANGDTNEPAEVPYIDSYLLNGHGQKVLFEVYGCQMNVNDAEVAWAILQAAGYEKTTELLDADIVLMITCAIREGAEQKIWNRIQEFTKLKKKRMLDEAKLRPRVGILGCMAERLKEKVLEKERLVDLVAGPDSYKDLPRLLALTRSYRKAINVLLSIDETYADVMPVQLNSESRNAYVSIMRGCNNMCTYCIVPFTRGRERSRTVDSILSEVRMLSEKGIKEVTLLGQNVNSYRDMTQISGTENDKVQLAKGFKTVYKLPKRGFAFADLLDKVSDVDPEMRIRFTSPHPKDFPDEVLQVIKSKPNICKSIHLPVQAGNNEILERMRRGYTREAYIDLVDRIRGYLPDVAFSSDFIFGFCGETEEQFHDSLSLMERVRYTCAFVFAYSVREKTTAHRRYPDDVPREEKLRRIQVASDLYRGIAEEMNQTQIGEHQLILIEKDSRRSTQDFAGRNDRNVKVVIPKCQIPSSYSSLDLKEIKVGDYICVKITQANSQGFKGEPLWHTTLQEFHNSMDSLNSLEKKLRI